MPSSALNEWRSIGAARLSELDSLHALATGRPGAHWGTTQLSRSLLVALVAQFQGFCRGLHDDAVAVHVVAATPHQRPVVESLLTRSRALDKGNPRRDTLGADFGRLGFSFIDHLKARGSDVVRRLETLDHLVDYRNAISHGNETQLAALEATTAIRSTEASYRHCRGELDQLADTMDDEVAVQLSTLLKILRPW